MSTALSAAPRSNWSPHTKRSRPFSPVPGWGSCEGEGGALARTTCISLERRAVMCCGRRTEDVILAHTAYLDVVLARGGERHRVDVLRRVIDECKAWRVAEDLGEGEDEGESEVGGEVEDEGRREGGGWTS